MPLRLDARSEAFERSFASLIATKRETAEDVDVAVQKIIAAVRRDGDAALVDLSRKFDRASEALGKRIDHRIVHAIAAVRQ